jgi:hypothetical protein
MDLTLLVEQLRLDTSRTGENNWSSPQWPGTSARNRAPSFLMRFEKAVQTLCDAGQVTYDLDICYSRSSANLRSLVEALAPRSLRLG